LSHRTFRSADFSPYSVEVTKWFSAAVGLITVVDTFSLFCWRLVNGYTAAVVGTIVVDSHFCYAIIDKVLPYPSGPVQFRESTARVTPFASTLFP
jgi:hypothetical protein